MSLGFAPHPAGDDMSGREELARLLGAVRRRWLAQTLAGTIGRATAAAAVPIAAAGVLARLVAFSGWALLATTLAALLLAIAAMVLVVLRMRRRPDDGQVARFVEEQVAAAGAAPALSDALVSAVQVAHSPGDHAPGFATLIVATAVKALRGIHPSAVIAPVALRRALLEGIGGLAVLGLAATVAFPAFLRGGAIAWVALFPESIEITVNTGHARVAAGSPLEISASIRGRGARMLGVVPSLVVAADGQQRSVAMVASDGGFAYAFESVDRSFEYRVTAGPAKSAPYSVTALVPPRVTRIDVHYEYPSFTGQRPRLDEDAGDIYGPAGTRVELRIHTDKPVATGEIALAEGGPLALGSAGSRLVTAGLVLTRDDGYRVKLTDTDGLSSRGELEYFIRVMDDRPPGVRIVRPAADQGITPLEEVAIEARADDDYGVAELELVYAVAGRTPRKVAFTRLSGTDVAKVGSHVLEAEGLGVKPGDVITYYAQARDVARGKRPTTTRSDIFFLEVKPFNQEFVAAQSQAMGGAGGTQIDSLIEAQKEIINATWSLERRSGAGRSELDMKAVGQAQAELKARLEQMIRGGRRGSAEILPQQVLPPRPSSSRADGADPVHAAIQAMQRAIEQLDRARTAEAIPHEMAALRGLLQAQAEVQRQQVMRQAANSAGQGGTGRTDRDLSALFDRELQRQQRTNYETPQSSQAPERQERSDALDRIRDLARRQEELAKRQRELAGAHLSAEERQRQLERLTREQEELRRQAEELEKQLQRSTGRGETARGTSPSGRNAEEVRRAAEEMRRGAQEMQRQNAEGAASSSDKAVEALRHSERQMRGGTTDARQRAAGELQLEAQQIADAQRRVAGEVSRLEKAPPPDPDALRRLAGEKDKLADRIDDLQRTTRDLEREASGEAAARFREAAQQLQGQRVGERMRSTAKEMRERATGGAARPSQRSQAEAEQQLSRALDSVVDRLGGDAEARRLTDALDRARQMRERLATLEQQVRAAEQNATRGGQPQGPAAPQRGRSGREAGRDGSAEQHLARAREEYARELERSREALSRLQSAQQQNGLGGSTPEHQEFSRSSPGDEAFKQDFSGWERLRKDLDVRLERYESALVDRLARKLSEDRLTAGGSDRVPDAYRQSVSRYFESLAKDKK